MNTIWINSFTSYLLTLLVQWREAVAHVVNGDGDDDDDDNAADDTDNAGGYCCQW